MITLNQKGVSRYCHEVYFFYDAGKVGRFFTDMINNKMPEFGGKIVSEAYSNGMKSAYDMAKDVSKLNPNR